MTYKVPHWTAAAILMAAIAWLAQSGTTPAFAVDEVVDNLVRARSAQYDMTATVIGQPTQKMKVYYLEPNFHRQEMYAPQRGHIQVRVSVPALVQIALNQQRHLRFEECFLTAQQRQSHYLVQP